MTIDFTTITSATKLRELIESHEKSKVPFTIKDIETFKKNVELELEVVRIVIKLLTTKENEYYDEDGIKISKDYYILYNIHDIIENIILCMKIYGEKLDLSDMNRINLELIKYFNDELEHNSKILLMQLYSKVDILHGLLRILETKNFETFKQTYDDLSSQIVEIRNHTSRRILRELNPSIENYIIWLNK